MITSPAFRYHGAKFRISGWVHQHLPAHRTYVEPFGGRRRSSAHESPQLRRDLQRPGRGCGELLPRPAGQLAARITDRCL